MTDPTMPSSDRDPRGDDPRGPAEESLGTAGPDTGMPGTNGEGDESTDVDPGGGDLPEDADLTTP